MAVQGWRWAPRVASQVTCDMKVRRIEFGDGYEQVIPQGDHAPLREWDLMFIAPPHECVQMQEFLRARRGSEAFDWTDPDTGLTVIVRCEQYSREATNNVRHTLRAKFREVRVAP